MWIIPNNLQLSNGAPDTEAFISDLNEQSQICASSLMVRSKPSPARTWSQKWRRDSWTRHLSGRILKPSQHKSFVTEWTCLWPVIPASHSAQQGNDSEQKTLVTSGLTSLDQFELFAPDSVSSRMSKDTSRWDSPASLATWKSWVTRCRGEYSLRVKSALLTRGKECSSWPTASTRDHKDSPGMSLTGVNPDGTERKRTDQLARAVYASGLAAPANPSTAGSRRESWATPNAFCYQPPENTEQWTKRAGYQQTEKGVNLHKPIQTQVLHEVEKQWATPRANKVHPEITEDNRDHLANRNKSNLEEEIAGHCGKATGKLNPRWVETLMGLPIGWTMPSCTRPVTIEPMNCDCLETESSQPPQNEHLELF